MNSVRQRKLIKLIKEMDAFPKIEEDHQEKTASGGGLSLMVFGLILILVIFEINYYLDQDFVYHYEIDKHYDRKLNLNIDIMIAMPCQAIGADIIDMTDESMLTFGSLDEQDIDFDLDLQSLNSFKHMEFLNNLLLENHASIHSSLWKSKSFWRENQNLQNLFPFKSNELMDSNERKKFSREGCRLKGTLQVNKLAGNFHVTIGKALKIGDSHLHLSFDDEISYNFSHRILQFSFGDENPFIFNPLDFHQRISNNSNKMFQYFLQVVPTSMETTFSAPLHSFQYAATEQHRIIDHSKGSHGLTGIYFRYDLSPLKVKVVPQKFTFFQFLVRLCGIIGGIFATSNFIHQIFSSFMDFLCCRRSSSLYLYNSLLSSSDEKNKNLLSKQPPVIFPPSSSSFSSSSLSPSLSPSSYFPSSSNDILNGNQPNSMNTINKIPNINNNNNYL